MRIANHQHTQTSENKMTSFLRNLALLAGLAIVLFIIAPEGMKGILDVYNGLGIIPIIVIMVIVAAIPKKSRRRR